VGRASGEEGEEEGAALEAAARGGGAPFVWPESGRMAMAAGAARSSGWDGKDAQQRCGGACEFDGEGREVMAGKDGAAPR
jgi:D-hexose-6-phosphate mutarotase